MYKKYFPIILLLALPTIWIACNAASENKSETTAQEEVSDLKKLEEKSWQEVMDIHDEVMPRMGEINRLKRNISKQLKSAEESLQTETAAKMKEAVDKLEEADKMMMDWMSSFSNGYTNVQKEGDHKKIMEYLEMEKGNITEVKNAMLGSIELGKKIAVNGSL